jgi:hypothetical protein
MGRTWSLAQSNCAMPTGMSYRPRPGLSSVAVAHRRQNHSAMALTQRLAFRPRQERCPSRPKARPVRTLGHRRQETLRHPPQRWMRPNPLAWSRGSTQPTSKKQKPKMFLQRSRWVERRGLTPGKGSALSLIAALVLGASGSDAGCGIPFEGGFASSIAWLIGR